MPPPAVPPPEDPPPDDPPELDEPPPDALPPADEPPPDEPPAPPPLEDELPDEPLDPELPPGGMDADGLEGVVGILADGQPAKSGRIAATAIRPFIALPFTLMPPSLQRLALPNAWVQIPM